MASLDHNEELVKVMTAVDEKLEQILKRADEHVAKAMEEVSMRMEDMLERLQPSLDNPWRKRAWNDLKKLKQQRKKNDESTAVSEKQNKAVASNVEKDSKEAEPKSLKEGNKEEHSGTLEILKESGAAGKKDEEKSEKPLEPNGQEKPDVPNNVLVKELKQVEEQKTVEEKEEPKMVKEPNGIVGSSLSTSPTQMKQT